MKLGSLKDGGRDGTLIVVSRDLARAVAVPDLAPTLQAALESWAEIAPRLESVSDALNATAVDDDFALDTATLASPLPSAH